MFNQNYYTLMGEFMRLTGTLSSERNTTCRTYDGGTVTTIVNGSSGNAYNYVMGLAYHRDAGTPFSQIYCIPSLHVMSNNTKIFINNIGTETAQANSTGVIIGDGDGVPSSNDYKLSGNIITDFTAVTDVNITYGENGVLINGVYDVFNTGNEPFTIKEIGLTRASIISVSASRILLDHTKLVTPVTINPGESKTIIYQIKFAA